MSSHAIYTNLNDFLIKHHSKNYDSNAAITHTRIGDKTLNIYGGSFHIPPEELPTFYKLYYEHVFVNKKDEYLTEKQLTLGNGPVAVDFDFRYEYNVTTRQHNENHITDIICEYVQLLKECFAVEKDVPFPVYIFEKPAVNRVEDKQITKDGIHMIIGVQVDHVMQTLMRTKMLERIGNVLEELPLTNTLETVLDEGISKGTTNWQLFGSKKPKNQAYKLTHHFTLCLEKDGEYAMNEEDVEKFDLSPEKLAALSVQYERHPAFPIHPSMQKEYDALKEAATGVKKAGIKINRLSRASLVDEDGDEREECISIQDIHNRETLERAVMVMVNHFQPHEYEIQETHYFTQALPEKYYEPGSHLLNRMVAFALKRTDDRLFLSWVQLRSKAADFDYATIPALYNEWKKFNSSNNSGQKITRRSIMYWVRKENTAEYEKIKQSTVDFYLQKAFETGTEYDIAMVLRQLYKDRFVCVSYDKKGIWYQFKNHRWVTDKGMTLRSLISQELYTILDKKMEQLAQEIIAHQEDEQKKTILQKKMKTVGEIQIKLRKTADKDHIMREAAEIFYDGEFTRTVDTNKYLLCFNNGVVDFQQKIFREGYPEDYITKCTNINYLSHLDPSEDYVKTAAEVDDFMSKLFPVPELKKYMRDHFASCLIGVNKNQTFNVYHGSGSNGKSIVTDLMSVALGEYKSQVPISLVTGDRVKIGGTSEEIIKLKGVRYAVLQESKKNEKLNESIMKELTGGDPLQGRGLFCETEIFEPQFSLVICTNSLFDIESNDDGTWRRIRKCDFLAKFVDPGETYEVDTPYVFPKDKDMKEKFPKLAPVFMSMLVARAFETGGLVEDCDMVLEASRKYRRSQDHISAFVSEKIVRTNDTKDKLKKTEIFAEFKKWYEESQGTRKTPRGDELYEFMNKRFGQCKATGWQGVKIIYPDEEEE